MSRVAPSLRARTLWTILAVVVPGTAAFLLADHLAVGASFRGLERADAVEDVERCVEGLRSEVDTVKRVVSDYGQWDDAYQFVVDGNETFVASNCTVDTFAVNKLEVMWFVDNDGRVAFGRCYDLATKEPRDLPELPTTTWPRHHPLLGTAEAPAVTGFLPTSLGTLVVASRPITRSDGSGPPRGHVVMGRFLTPAIVAGLRDRVKVAFEVLPARADAMPDPQVLPEASHPTGAALREVSTDRIDAFRAVPDVTGTPLLVVQAMVGREITARGRTAALWALAYGIAVGTAILVALYRFFGRSVVRPVTALGEQVRTLAADLERAAGVRLPVARHDEVGLLAEDVNTLLTRLDETRRHLEAAKDVAEAASAAKGRFVAHMSHEIRTPINGILGMTEVLLRSRLDPDQRRCAETVKACSEALLAMIGDILDFSKIEAGRLDLEAIPFELEDVLEQAVAVVGHAAETKGLSVWVRVEPGVPAVLASDPTRLRQVLVNLLGNAVKFTHEGEIRLRVSVEREPEGRAEVRFAVSDSGVGIPKDRIGALFRSFQQGETSTTRRFGGTGLGLAISRGIVRGMGGRIGVESEEGHGSTFWFTLPLAADAPADEPAPPRWLGRRALVAVPSETGRSALAATLARWGFSVETVAGVGPAMRAVERSVVMGEPFDLVVARVQRNDPELDVVERLAGSRARRRALVLLAPAAALDERLERLRRLVDARLVVDPHVPRALAKAVGSALEGGPAEGADAPSASPPVRRLRVLVAEDNGVNQEVARRLLEGLGHAVTLVPDGVDAVARAAEGGFDLVLMDVQMPRMDGYEAARTIRAREAEHGRPRVPMVALTASAITGERERCVEAGMDGFLGKPIRLPALERLLADTASRRPAAPPEDAAPPGDAGPAPTGDGPAFDLSGLGLPPAETAALAVDVAKAFRDAAPKVLARLVAGIDAADPTEVGRAAHTLKGSCLNLRAPAMVEHLAAVEAAARAGDLVPARERRAAIEAGLARLVAEAVEVAASA